MDFNRLRWEVEDAKGFLSCNVVQNLYLKNNKLFNMQLIATKTATNCNIIRSGGISVTSLVPMLEHGKPNLTPQDNPNILLMKDAFMLAFRAQGFVPNFAR
jgi:hypothetical protein